MLVCVALEVDFHTFWQEALATCCTAAAQDGTAVYRLAASTEAELLLAGALGGLIRSLGHGLGRLMKGVPSPQGVVPIEHWVPAEGGRILPGLPFLSNAHPV